MLARRLSSPAASELPRRRIPDLHSNSNSVNCSASPCPRLRYDYGLLVLVSWGAPEPTVPRSHAGSTSSPQSNDIGLRGVDRVYSGRGPAPYSSSRSSKGQVNPSDPYNLRLVTDLPSLAVLVDEHVATWSQTRNVIVLRAASYSLGKLGSAPGGDRPTRQLTEQTFQLLAGAYLPLAPRLRDAYSCVGPLWTCAKLDCWDIDGGLAAALLGRMGKDPFLLAQAKGQDHSYLWWSVSVAPPPVVTLASEPLATSASCLLEMSPEQLKSQEWSNILLACARLKYGSTPALLHHLTSCLTARQDANCQDLANALYSLGELAEDCGHTPRPTNLQLLADGVVGLLQQPKGRNGGRGGSIKPSFKPQELSNMLLGCAKLGYTDPALLQPLAAAAGQAAPRMKPQELANSLWALAALRPDCWEEVVEGLAEECRRRAFEGFKPQELSNSVWALAKLGWAQDQGWYKAAVAAALQPGAMAGANSQDWSNLCYGLALVRHRPAEAFLEAMVADQSEDERPHSCGSKGQQSPLEVLRSGASGQDCANLLWSLAVLGLYQERLVEVLAKRLWKLLQKDPAFLADQELCNSLWAFAVMGPDVLARMTVLVERMLQEAVRRWKRVGEGQGTEASSSFSDERLVQLWQVQQELVHSASSVVGDSGSQQGPERILPSCRSLMVAVQRAAKSERIDRDPSISRLQRKVVDVLHKLKSQLAPGAIVSVEPECPVEELCGRVDVMVVLDGGRRVAVEVDGPTHFLANPPHTRTKDGPTQLRDRQLERVFGAGNVVNVPYWEWMVLKNKDAQQEHLRQLLGLEASASWGG